MHSKNHSVEFNKLNESFCVIKRKIVEDTKEWLTDRVYMLIEIQNSESVNQNC